MKPNRSGSAKQRTVTDPYTDQEFGAAVLRTQRAGWFSLVLRAATVAVVFVLMARAIAAHDLSPMYLLMPLFVEFLVIFWLGWVLARWFVDCPAFHKTGGSFASVLLWTGLFLFVLWAAHAGDFVQGMRTGWAKLSSSGLHYAIGASLLGLLLSTAAEVWQWRRKRGVFVWTSIMNTSLRIAALVVLGFVVLMLGVFGGFVWLSSAGAAEALGPQAPVWLTFWGLMAIELLAIGLGLGLYQKAQLDAAAALDGSAQRSS